VKKDTEGGEKKVLRGGKKNIPEMPRASGRRDGGKGERPSEPSKGGFRSSGKKSGCWENPKASDREGEKFS